MDENEKKNKDIKDQKNWLEWVVFGVSLVLVLSIVTYLGYQAYIHKPVTPKLTAEKFHDPSDNAPNRYRIVLHNKGGETAEEVKVEVRLLRNGEVLEESELGFPFAPQESQREGWVNFRSNTEPQDSVLVHVVSYKKP
ncbi:hypothetical protein [Pontibacter akesuensis]|uniref:TIGR02588 family protein n=1 Tax=Pontibacter akesuensis TaxID=388950 RepID=A0A1I7GTT9_9BACT|nr:hypothetical protein [Pontibacter akesuensis]GHA55114.1 hypothetical protein GCM10007389_03120 [Pontibacter akesuensis]SFU51829.1 TIGR02588 family protein [Pontibacter akesuensis]